MYSGNGTDFRLFYQDGATFPISNEPSHSGWQDAGMPEPISPDLRPYGMVIFSAKIDQLFIKHEKELKAGKTICIKASIFSQCSG